MTRVTIALRLALAIPVFCAPAWAHEVETGTGVICDTREQVQRLALLLDQDAQAAIKADPGIREGVNTFQGHLTYSAVAESQRKPFKPVKDLVA